MEKINDVFDFFKMHTSSKNCIFYRVVGVNSTFLEDILELDKTCYGVGIYKRISFLPKLDSVNDSDFYIKKYENWINSKKRVGISKNVSITHNFSSKMGKAINDVIAEYNKLSVTNPTIEKNFVIKLLFWFDFLIGDEVLKLEEDTVVKIICENIKSKHEYLFFYFLKLLGMNIVLLQIKDDISQTEKSLNLSKDIWLGKFSHIEIPTFSLENINKKTTVINPSNNKPLNLIHPNRKTITKPVQEDNPANTVQSPKNSEKSYEELASLASSVVMITSYDDKGVVIGTGSGIIIGQKGFILTNSHVIAGGSRFSVKLENDETQYLTDNVVKYHSNYDLAIIRINKLLTTIPVYKGSNKLVRGQKVIAIGSPLGLFNSVSDGIISGFRAINNINMIQFTAPISAGSSGGAVLNINGEVIGISTAGMDLGQNLNLAVGYEYINDFIGNFID